MKYNPSLGIFGNITKLFEESTKTNNQVYNNKTQTDQELLEIEADQVESVIDEYNAIVGEEEQDV